MAKAIPMGDDDYEAECDMQTLVRAEEIRKDKKRLAAAQAAAKKKIADMQSVAGEKK
jgi:hypothetical protein